MISFVERKRKVAPASRLQDVKQRLRLLQIERVETFSEPAVNRIARLLHLTLVAPEPCEFVAVRSSAPATISDNTNSNAATNGHVVAYAPTLVCSKKSLLALSYSVLDAARHPSQGGCCAPSDTQENANKGTVVAQSQGVNPVALVLSNMLMARTN